MLWKHVDAVQACILCNHVDSVQACKCCVSMKLLGKQTTAKPCSTGAACADQACIVAMERADQACSCCGIMLLVWKHAVAVEQSFHRLLTAQGKVHQIVVDL